MKMKIIVIVTIVCASIFGHVEGHVEPSLLGVLGGGGGGLSDVLDGTVGGLLPGVLNGSDGSFLSILNEDERSLLSGLPGGVGGAVGLLKPDPEKISKSLLKCLYGEFELLARAAVPVVVIIVKAVLLFCGCTKELPPNFFAELSSRVAVVLHEYAIRESDICNAMAISALRESSNRWNILQQPTLHLKLFLDLNAKLREGVLDAIQSTVDVIIPYLPLPCNKQKDECEQLLRSLLKLLYDRVGFVAALITTANLLYLLLRLSGCMKISYDLIIPLGV